MRGNDRPACARRLSFWAALAAVLIGCIAVAPSVEVEPSSLEFVAVLGGENPLPQLLWVADSADATAPFQASCTADWVTITPWPLPEMGVPSRLEGEWMVDVAIQGLAEGEHHAEIELADADGFLVATVPVTLTVTSPTDPEPPCVRS